jgi:hypothetical protein
VASKLLIIEPEVGSSVPIHLQLPAPTQRTTWSEFANAKLDITRTQLILAGASREIPYSLSFLAGLCTAPFAVPVVAVLPSISDADVLRTAAEAADDFLLCPVHGEELNLRIRKLLGEADPRRARTGRALVNESVLAQLIGEHPVFLDALNQIERFRFSDAPVLTSTRTLRGRWYGDHLVDFLGNGFAVPLAVGGTGLAPRRFRILFPRAPRERCGLSLVGPLCLLQLSLQFLVFLPQLLPFLLQLLLSSPQLVVFFA